MNSPRFSSKICSAVGLLAVICLLSSGVRGGEGEGARNLGCPCRDPVGNVNCDYADLVTLGDLALLLDHLYISSVRLPNEAEANTSGDPEGVINVTDVAVLIDHLFLSGIELPPCPVPLNAPPGNTNNRSLQRRALY